MMRYINKIFPFLFFPLIFLSACKGGGGNEPQNGSLASSEFTSGYAVFYGSYYDYLDISENVVAMSLFSPKLTTDSLGYYVGVGTNLILTDIFISAADTLLPQGHYESNDDGMSHTFLKGKSFDENPIGAYMLVITETGYSTEILPEGSFDLSTRGDSVFIDFDFKRTNGKSYTPSFRGKLPMYDAR